MQKSLIRVIVVLVLLGVFVWHAVNVHRSVENNGTYTDKPITYDTGGKIPGDPDHTVACMKRIYQMIEIYRSRNNDSYPDGVNAILKDAYNNPVVYGLKSGDHVNDYFTSPDVQYRDTYRGQFPYPQSAHVVPFQMSNERPDHSMIGTSHPAGVRDVLVWTDMYVHQNSHYIGHRVTENPVGFYLVLFDNGQVEKIPYDQVYQVSQGDGNYTLAFQGEAGIPVTAISYDNWYTRVLGWKKAPHGERLAVDGRGDV